MNALATYVAPDRFHVKQHMWDDANAVRSGDPMLDEWFMLGAEYYEPFIGALVAAAGNPDPVWVQNTGRERKAMNDLVLADTYVGLLQDNEPWVSLRLGDGAAYLVADRRVAMILDAPMEGEHLRIGARHDFATTSPSRPQPACPP